MTPSSVGERPPMSNVAIDGIQGAPVVLSENSSYRNIEVSYTHVSPLNLTLFSENSGTTTASTGAITSTSSGGGAAVNCITYFLGAIGIVAIIVLVSAVAKKSQKKP
jgi:hypothetical protein